MAVLVMAYGMPNAWNVAKPVTFCANHSPGSMAFKESTASIVENKVTLDMPVNDPTSFNVEKIKTYSGKKLNVPQITRRKYEYSIFFYYDVFGGCLLFS